LSMWQRSIKSRQLYDAATRLKTVEFPAADVMDELQKDGKNKWTLMEVSYGLKDHPAFEFVGKRKLEYWYGDYKTNKNVNFYKLKTLNDKEKEFQESYDKQRTERLNHVKV
jgi:hypothetical protein